MTQENIQSLLDKLGNYGKQNQLLQDLNFSSAQVKQFKKYYTEMYSELVEFVRMTKHKHLSEKGKSLKLFSDIFGKTTQLLQIMTITVFISILGLVYLYYLESDIRLIISVTLVVILFFSLLFRQIQLQTKELITTLNKNGEVIEDLRNIISKMIDYP